MHNRIVQFKLHILIFQSPRQILDLDTGNTLNLAFRQRMEHHHFVYPVDELRAEVRSNLLHDCRLHGVVVFLTRLFLNDVRAQVGGHHDHGIPEVDRTALAVGQATIIQHLQQDIEDIRMGLFHLIQQQHRVRPAAHRLGQVSTLFIAHVTGRRTDQTSDGVLLHELGHIDPHHGLFGIKQERCQGLTQLGLAHTGRPEEQERAIRPVGIRQPGPGPTHRIGDRLDRFMLADHPVMEGVFHPHQFIPLALKHLRYRNAGPLGDNFGDFLVGYPVTQQLHFHHFSLAGHIQLALQFRNGAVLKLRHFAQIASAAGVFQVNPGLLQLALDLLGAMQRRFLGVPDFFQIGVFAFDIADHRGQLFQPLFGSSIGFFLQGLAFNLELNQAPLQAIQRLGLGIHFHTNLACRFVYQIDGLIRQLAIGDITMGQFRGGDDRAISHFHTVVNFVALFEATKNRNGVFLTGLGHQYFLETALKRCVFLDVFPVFVQGGGAYAVQLSPCQRRLEHVTGVHGAFGFAGADHGMDLIDEQDDLTFLFGQFVEHGFQALFELTAELGAGDEGTHVQRQHLFIFEAVRHFTVDDALGQAFNDGRFTHTRLTNQHGVVLAAALEYLDGAANFVITADDRVQFAGFGPLGEVDGVFGQRLTVFFGTGVVDGFAAAHGINGFFQGSLVHALFSQHTAEGAAVFDGCQQNQLTGNELVAALLGQFVGHVEQPAHVV